MSQIPFIDLAKQQSRILPEIERRMAAVLKHGQYVLGPEIAELEGKLAAYTGAKHCITVSSGTDALLIALMAIGIEPGDEVITTPFTFIATGEVIAPWGKRPHRHCARGRSATSPVLCGTREEQQLSCSSPAPLRGGGGTRHLARDGGGDRCFNHPRFAP